MAALFSPRVLIEFFVAGVTVVLMLSLRVFFRSCSTNLKRVDRRGLMRHNLSVRFVIMCVDVMGHAHYSRPYR